MKFFDEFGNLEGFTGYKASRKGSDCYEFRPVYGFEMENIALTR